MKRLIANLTVLVAVVTVTSCAVSSRTGYSDSFDRKKNRDKVFVGITRNGMPDKSRKNFAKCIHDAGAAVYFFPTYPENDSIIGTYLDRVHSIIVPGSTSGDTAGRMNYDMRIIQTAFDRQMPVLGICFGHQAINKTFGGPISRISGCYPDSQIQHAVYDGDKNIGLLSEAHPISIDTTSTLYKLYGTDSLNVNTSHRYCTPEPPANLKVVAMAPDGVVEALEATGLMGLQYHPEYLYGRMKLKKHLNVFRHIASEGAKYREYLKTGYWSRPTSWYEAQRPVDTSLADVFYLVSTEVMRDTIFDGTIRPRASLTDDQKSFLKKEMFYVANRVFRDSLNFFSAEFNLLAQR